MLIKLHYCTHAVVSNSESVNHTQESKSGAVYSLQTCTKFCDSSLLYVLSQGDNYGLAALNY
jgi:hypothetical protein